MGYASYQESINDHRGVVSGLLEELQKLAHSQERKRADAAGLGAHLAAVEGAALRTLKRSEQMISEADAFVSYLTAPEQNVALDVFALRDRVSDLQGQNGVLASRNHAFEQAQNVHVEQVRQLNVTIENLRSELNASQQRDMSDRELDKLINKKKNRPR